MRLKGSPFYVYTLSCLSLWKYDHVHANYTAHILQKKKGYYKKVKQEFGEEHRQA